MHQADLLPRCTARDIDLAVQAKPQLHRREGVQQLVGKHYGGARLGGAVLARHALGRPLHGAARASGRGRQRGQHRWAAVGPLSVTSNYAEATLALPLSERRRALHDDILKGGGPSSPDRRRDAQLIPLHALLDVCGELARAGAHFHDAEGRTLLKLDPHHEEQPAEDAGKVRRQCHWVRREVRKLLRVIDLAGLGAQHSSRGVVTKIVSVLGVRVELIHGIELPCVNASNHDVDPALGVRPS
mmetsp:Transcript_49342/g.147368  ORF Transcript_49342/g.147368 Transcript_49342/m.147368 type:complete len:243 (+) Transcript_49342:864-1592(+)